MNRRTLDGIRAGMTPNVLDRVVNFIAPTWGEARMRSRAMLAIGGAFTGSSRTRPEGQNYTPTIQSADDEICNWDRQDLIARSADLERNDAVGGGIIAEYITSVVGTGLSLHLEPRRRALGWDEDQAAEWAQDVQDRFALWAENANECDIGRKRNFYQGQVQAMSTVATRGDCFAVLPNFTHPGGIWGTKIQLIEGDRCLMPQGKTETALFRDGIELDIYGAPKRYWFADRHPLSSTNRGDIKYAPVDAFDSRGNRKVIHLFHEKRLDQRRGLPLLAPVILQLKQLSRLGESELMASVVTSMFAVLIEKAGGPGPLSGIVQQDTEGNPFTELGHGMIADLNPGEKIHTVAPNRPNGAYDPFFRGIVGQIAMRVQIPPEILFKKFESSYTAARGALLQFWKFISTERDQFLGPNYCQPIFDAWLAEDVASGRTQAPGFFRDPLLRYAYSSARWIGDNPPILDPLKEVMAAQELINYQFSTFEEQTMRLTGGSYEANIERLKRERRLREEAGIPDPAAKPIDPNIVHEEPTDDEQIQAFREGMDRVESRIEESARIHHDAMDSIRLSISDAKPSVTNIHVDAPAAAPAPSVEVNLPAITVDVHPPKGGNRAIQIERDEKGRLVGAHVEESMISRTVQLERAMDGTLTGASIGEE